MNKWTLFISIIFGTVKFDLTESFEGKVLFRIFQATIFFGRLGHPDLKFTSENTCITDLLQVLPLKRTTEELKLAGIMLKRPTS